MAFFLHFLKDIMKKEIMNIDAIRSFESLKIPTPFNSSGSNFAEQLSVTKADKLLQTTRQYAKWRMIRQNDPSKVVKIARLILERHAFIEGGKPTDEMGRNQFDRLTDKLKSEGIHLYKSHQFKNPIFEVCKAEGMQNKPKPNPIDDASNTKDKTLIQNLRYCFRNKDCLEFLADLLEENGIIYYGKNGVADALIAKAQKEGKNLNTYLTGEGLTQKLSSNPVTVTIKKDGSDSFEDVWNRIIPHIQKGTIVSFSSQAFGHTGIVDRVGNRWLYFNSSGTPRKPETYKVLAEDLKHEIHSWFQRAKRQKTFLHITVGAIDPNLAARFNNASVEKQHLLSRDIDLLAMHRVDQRDDIAG